MQIARTALSALVATLIVWSSASPSAVSLASAPTVPLAGPAAALTLADQELVAWARGRFSLVGLDLPDIDISFHDDTEPCNGYDGVYKGDGSSRRVLLCIPDLGTFGSHLQRQRTLIHEFTHAGEQASLDEDDRARLLEIVDAQDWYAPESAWKQRGAERFAETIVWGLYDQRRRPTLIDVSCRELHADFRSITGSTAPGPLEQICALEQSVSATKRSMLFTATYPPRSQSSIPNQREGART